MIKIVNKINFVFLLCASTQITNAAELPEYEFRVGATRSDNVFRTDMFEMEETIALVGLILDAQHVSPRVQANLLTDVEYRSYSGDTFDNDVVGALNANLLLQFLPETFSWSFEDQFGQLQSSPFEANTPANRENINRFSTGPDLRFRIGSTTALEVAGRFYLNDFEDSDTDSDVRSGRISMVTALSPRRTISVNATADRVQFSDTISNFGYDRLSAFVGFESEVSRGSIAVRLGLNELHDLGEVIDGNLIHVSWNRDISPTAGFNLTYEQRLTDAADTLGRTQAPGQGFADQLLTAGVTDPFTNERMSLGLDVIRNNTNFYASASYNNDEYVTQTALNRYRTEISFGLSRVVGSMWRVRLGGTLQKIEFAATGRGDDDTVLRAGLSRQLTRLVAVNLDFTRFDRDSSLPAFDYLENTISLTFSFRDRRRN